MENNENIQETKEPFYSQTWFVIIMTLFCCLPLGLFLMWKYEKFNKPARIAITAIFIVMYAASFLLNYHH